MAATTPDVLAHHLTCVGKGDLAGMMADYAAESRFFTPDGPLRGSEANRGFFRQGIADQRSAAITIDITAITIERA